MFIDAALATCSSDTTSWGDMLLGFACNVVNFLMVCGVVFLCVRRMWEDEAVRRIEHEAKLKALQTAASQVEE